MDTAMNREVGFDGTTVINRLDGSVMALKPLVFEYITPGVYFDYVNFSDLEIVIDPVAAETSLIRTDRISTLPTFVSKVNICERGVDAKHTHAVISSNLDVPPVLLKDVVRVNDCGSVGTLSSHTTKVPASYVQPLVACTWDDLMPSTLGVVTSIPSSSIISAYNDKKFAKWWRDFIANIEEMNYDKHGEALDTLSKIMCRWLDECSTVGREICRFIVTWGHKPIKEYPLPNEDATTSDVLRVVINSMLLPLLEPFCHRRLKNFQVSVTKARRRAGIWHVILYEYGSCRIIACKDNQILTSLTRIIGRSFDLDHAIKNPWDIVPTCYG